MRLLCLLPFSSLALACTGEPSTSMAMMDPEGAQTLGLPAAPAQGLQIILPVVRGIRPGTSIEVCSWTDRFLDRDVEVTELVGAQAGPGHHVSVYFTRMPLPAGTSRECEDQDMVNFTYVAAAFGEGNSGISRPPAGLSFFMPKGAQVVVLQHFLNATTGVLEGQSGVNLHYADPSKTYVRSSALSFANTGILVPPGESSAEFLCTMEEDMAAWLLFPHMHEWGRHILIEQGSGGVTSRLFDVEWSEGFVFHPPERSFGLEAPHRFRKGDTVRVRCTWDNTTSKTLLFGQEMCVASGHIVDTRRIGNSLCNNGRWIRF